MSTVRVLVAEPPRRVIPVDTDSVADAQLALDRGRSWQDIADALSAPLSEVMHEYLSRGVRKRAPRDRVNGSQVRWRP